MPFKDSKRNRWRGQIKWQGQRLFADFRTRKEAVAWEAEKRRELQETTQAPTRTSMDLVSFFARYLEFAELRFTQKVFDEKKSLCHRFLEFHGNMGTDELTADLVMRYLTRQAQRVSANVFNRDRKNLMAMWNWGQSILDLPSNPVAKINKLPHDRSPQYTPPTKDVLAILAAATPEERVFLQCYLQTGARRSEIFRLTWNEDINFEKKEIRLGTRKTRDSSMEYAWLPMSDALHEELWWWWQNRPIKDTPYVFVSTSKKPGRHFGNPYKERRWFMETICKRAGVKPFGFHALRRYVASILADRHKLSSKTVQRILRHKSVHTTERYLANLNNDLSAVMNLLGEKVLQDGTPNNSKGLGNES